MWKPLRRKNGVDTGLGWCADGRYLVYNQRDYLGYVYSTAQGERHFYKQEEGWAISVLCTNRAEWTGPILISTDYNAAIFHDEEMNIDVEPTETFAYLGFTWYYNTGHNLNNALAYEKGISPYFDASNYQNIAEVLGPVILEVAGVHRKGASIISLVRKTILQNGSYSAITDGADGYSEVIVNVPNTYTSNDEGKVVEDGALVSQTTQTISENGTYDTTTNDEVIVNVENTFSDEDEGKVIQNGELVSQTPLSITANGTYDTTIKDEVTVDVQSAISTEDEGKVVNNGALVPQTSLTVTENDTYDTTLNNEVIVNVENTYTSEDEGKVVNNGNLTPQTSLDIAYNGLYNTTTNNQVNVNIEGALSTETKEVTIRENGVTNVYPSTDHVMTRVDVITNVPNTYSSGDQNKVVQGNELTPQTSMNISANGTYDTTLNNQVVVDVEGTTPTGSLVINANGTYDVTDKAEAIVYVSDPTAEGIVLSGEEAPAATDGNDGDIYLWYGDEAPEPFIDKTVTANGTYNADDDGVYGYSSVTVNVPNTFGSEDEGKVIENGELVNQTSINIDENGTYDTTLNNEVIVNIEGYSLGAEDEGKVVVRNTGADLGWEADSAYLISAANTDLGIVNDRHFYKTNNGPAIAVIRIHWGSSSWTSPMLISTDRDAVTYYYGGTTRGAEGSFEYLGLTWYYNGDHAYQNGNVQNTGNRPIYDDNYLGNLPQSFINILTAANVALAEEWILTPQTSLTVTENGTYDTTTNNEVVVNVSGGGSFVGDLIGEYNNAAQGGIWYSTGHSVSADSGFVVQYKINGTIIKTIYIEKERVAFPYNGAFASITTEFQSNGSFYGPTYNFNLRIVSGILEVSFGGASSGFVSAKVYTAGNAAEFFASNKPLLNYLNNVILNETNISITTESSMTASLDSTNHTLQVTWNSGSSIGIRYKPYFLIPSFVNSMHYKIETGSRSYDTSIRFAPGVGILPASALPDLKNGVEYNADRNNSSFLQIAYTQQRESILEGSFDLSNITEDTVLCIFCAGWDVTFSEIIFS